MEENTIDLYEPEEAVPDGGTEEHEGERDGSFTLKHLGETRTVGRDEVITLAQKGLDYDRIRRKYDETSARPSRMNAPVSAQEDETTAKRQAEIREFLAEYGTEVDPQTIPAEVWQSVADGRTLLAAYQAWELKRLRLESRAEQKNSENKTRSAGSRLSLETMKPRDAITEDWYNG